jgi:hypothetical protein
LYVTHPFSSSAAHAVAQEKISRVARVSFFIVGRIAAFEFILNHSKLKPTPEYSSQSEAYNEASGDKPA